MTATASASFAAKLKPLMISGKEVLPIIEGGKGVGASNGKSAGAFAAAGAVGTISAVNQLEYDAAGTVIPLVYKGTTRRERHEELVANGIRAGIQHAEWAHEISNGQGRIHMNILWEMGGADRVMEANEGTREELRLLGKVVSGMGRQIHNLQVRVDQLDRG